MKRKLLVFAALLLICFTLVSCECSHEWKTATCTEPKTCSLCGATDGEALGHSWTDATCTAPKTCSVCGATEGDALGHSWTDATCTAPKMCSVCGATEGEALGHSWLNATCTAPKTCSVCGATEGDALGHSWTDATCTAPKTCSVCGATEGDALGHTLTYHEGKEPTCTESGFAEYETCSVCGFSTFEEIPALGHDICRHEGKAATCEQSGFEAYDECLRCGYSTYKEIEATGHDFEGYTCVNCGLDYAVFCKVGKATTAKVSNSDVGYDFYKSQKNTGKYSNLNCGPTCVYMAGKWADPNFSRTVEEIRKTFRGGSGWTVMQVYKACVQAEINVEYHYFYTDPRSYNDKTILELLDIIDEGKVFIILFKTGKIDADAKNTGVTGRGYNKGSYGHYVLVKGYWIVDGKTYFEIYDPDLSLDYENPILGSDRTRYYDAKQLMHSAYVYDTEKQVMVITRK